MISGGYIHIYIIFSGRESPGPRRTRSSRGRHSRARAPHGYIAAPHSILLHPPQPPPAISGMHQRPVLWEIQTVPSCIRLSATPVRDDPPVRLSTHALPRPPLAKCTPSGARTNAADRKGRTRIMQGLMVGICARRGYGQGVVLSSAEYSNERPRNPLPATSSYV